LLSTGEGECPSYTTETNAGDNNLHSQHYPLTNPPTRGKFNEVPHLARALLANSDIEIRSRPINTFQSIAPERDEAMSDLIQSIRQRH